MAAENELVPVGNPTWDELLDALETMTRADLRRLAWEALIRSDGMNRRSDASLEGSPHRVNLCIAADRKERGFYIYNKDGWERRK